MNNSEEHREKDGCDPTAGGAKPTLDPELLAGFHIGPCSSHHPLATRTGTAHSQPHLPCAEEIANPCASDLPGAQTEGEPADDGHPTICGTVKWFDATKGYGFVTAEDDLGDILIHYKLLAPLRHKSLPDGTRVTLHVQQGPRGRHGTRIVDLDFTNAVTPEWHQAPATDAALAELGDASDFEAVQVRWFNRNRGYGFLLRDDGVTQIFIHMETVRRCGFRSLAPGQQLLAAIEHGPRGAHAVAIRPTASVTAD